ncbi:MAG TPA: hypothetical protein VES19_14295, partial [Candidatus Limnocylindrales bacterium]|nr:hypothetical protein [Candidatus Limnocylindrales bacterium]
MTDPMMSDPIDNAPGSAFGVGPDAAVPTEPRPGWWDRATIWFGGHPPTTPRQRARARAIRRGVIAGGVLVAVGSLVQLPLLILSPGPTYNTIGEVNG